jgi:transcription factor IIIB subunit 2
LSDYHIERAVQCYKLALLHNFTQGRKQGHVIAACLYTVCRQEKTMRTSYHHTKFRFLLYVDMLIDFTDVLHTNVYTLGNTFLKLIRLLNIQLPLIDPSLYLSRFAAQLEFGDKTQAVTHDALRLVQRMKRDWIHYGRRPSGICGACLLIAARMHGFQRTQNEIVRVVKICDMTLRKR